ncbi:MAG: hypothetical protein EOP46_12325 [Sphingobacteriaceae bacterium]|nr:MAG: hypothetical protein EOP46_12325 [Sphingobacteriaceae bacterium]
MEVLVFATNVTHQGQVSRVNTLLTGLPDVTDWNFDLDDCDNILRIVAIGLSPRHVETLLLSAGIKCYELAD